MNESNKKKRLQHTSQSQLTSFQPTNKCVFVYAYKFIYHVVKAINRNAAAKLFFLVSFCEEIDF